MMQNQNHIGHVSMDPEYQYMRSMMRNKICEVLKEMQPNPSSEWRLKLPDVSKRLEERIIMEFPNKGNYASILHNGVKTWIVGALNQMRQRRHLQLHQDPLQQQNHQNSATFHNFGSNFSTSCIMIPTPSMSSSETESNNMIVSRTSAAATGSHQPDLFLVQQHQSQGRPPQQIQQIQRFQAASTSTSTSNNKGSSSHSDKETQYLNQIKTILFLHHAKSCPVPVGHCPEKNCARAQKFVRHIEKCYQNECGVQNCLIARKCLLHFRGCKDPNCPVCVPVRKVLSISKQKASSVFSSFSKPVPIHAAAESSERGVLSSERAMNWFDSSGVFSDRRDGDPVSIDISKARHQTHPPKRQKMHVDVSSVPVNTTNAAQEAFPTEQRVNNARARLEMDTKLGSAGSCRPGVESSQNGVNVLDSSGVFSDQRVLIDISKARHQAHPPPQQPLPKRQKMHVDVSSVPVNTTNAVQEVFPTEQRVNNARARLEMDTKLGSADSCQPGVESSQNGANLLESSGVFSDQRVSIDISKARRQTHPPPQQPLSKRQKMHVDVSSVPVNTTNAVQEVFPTEQRVNNARARLEMDTKLSSADLCQPGVESSQNGVNVLDSSGVFSDQRVSIDISKARHQTHPPPQQPLTRKRNMHMGVVSYVPVNTTNAAQEVFSTEQRVNNVRARLEMDCKLGSADSCQPGVESSHNGANVLNSSGVFSDQRDGDPVSIDISKARHQKHPPPQPPLPKRQKMHIDVSSVPVNTTNAVQEVFPTEQRVNNARARLEMDCKLGSADSCQPGVESSENGTNLLDSSDVDQRVIMGASAVSNNTINQSFNAAKEVFPTENSTAVDLSQSDVKSSEKGMNELHSSEVFSDRRDGEPNLVNMEASPEPINTSNPSFSVLEETFPTELCDKNVGPARQVSVVVDNEEKINESAGKAIPEGRNKDETGDKSEKPKLKGVSLMELFTPEQVIEHINSLRLGIRQNKAKVKKHQDKKHLIMREDIIMEHSMSSENSCQLCKAERLAFELMPIYCMPCGARIKRNTMYYSLGTGEQRHVVCIPCYNAARGETVQIESHMVSKVEFEKKKNNEETEEAWVQCDKCEAWQHQICALFNGHRNNGGEAEYTCPKCYIIDLKRGKRVPLQESAMLLRAKDLARTKLSDFIEDRLSKRLEIERQQRANSLGKKRMEDVPGAEGLVLRVVSSVDKRLKVNPRFLEIFQEKCPNEFPYKSKALLLFQNIEGVEVCLFAMYVQEFGTECAFPNQRRVYISYLDSVKYFRPDIKTIKGEALRTFVYHEILIGYLEYCKKRGFVSCYIWACPPLKGEDYILYCHPEIQMIPKSDKLRQWYLSMLEKGKKEKIVVNHTNLYDDFFTQQDGSHGSHVSVTAARLPYFDGDYWPGAAEEIINQLLQEENDIKEQKRKPQKSTISKRTLKAEGRTNLGDNASKDAMLMQRLGEKIRPIKKDFIMVHLQHVCNSCGDFLVSGMRWVCNSSPNLNLCDSCHNVEQRREERERHTFSPVKITGVPTDTKDQDDILESEFFNTRHAFLSLCQRNNYQYDTLRRAKHSTMMMLYHLHNPTAPAFVVTCNTCGTDIETGQGWRCHTCPEFDLCNSCYEREGGAVNHPHQMTNCLSTVNEDAEHEMDRQNGVKQDMNVLDLLVHSSNCRSKQCEVRNCRKLKALFNHGRLCKKGISGGCTGCKKMWGLLHLHAQACTESKCNVPRCKDLREKYWQCQQRAESRRRAAVNEKMRQRTAEVSRSDDE